MSADLDANPHDHSLKMAFQENTKQVFVPCRLHYPCTASFESSRFWRPQATDILWEDLSFKVRLLSQTKRQSLLLDNKENRNSSLGNIILKSDFLTNHTQLVSDAIFLSNFGNPADFFLLVEVLQFP